MLALLGAAPQPDTLPVAYVTALHDEYAPRFERAAAKGVYDALHVAELVAHLKAVTRRFDVVTAADVLIYVGDLAAFFAAVGDCLAASGLLALTVEAAEDDGPGIDLRLRPSRRFAHSAAYVTRGAAAVGLTLRHHEETALRRDAAATIRGHVMVFEKPTLLP